jgi:xanthine dehydrogenase molybdopterin-binding subunit B
VDDAGVGGCRISGRHFSQVIAFAGMQTMRAVRARPSRLATLESKRSSDNSSMFFATSTGRSGN